MRALRAGRRRDRHAQDERGQYPQMEFCRRWGIAEQVHDCPFPGDWPLDVVFVTSLAGYELGRLRRPPRNAPTTTSREPGAVADLLADVVRPDPANFAHRFPACGCAIAPHSNRSRMRATASSPTSPISRAAARARERGLSGGLRRRQQHGAAGARHRAHRQGVLGHPLNLFFRAPDLLETCGRERGTFFLGIDRDGLWANIRVIDPANGLWRVMAFDSGGARRRGRPRSAGAARRGQADRCRICRPEHLDAAQRGGRTLQQGPRASRRRCRAPAFADRRLGMNTGHRRCGRSRLEARRHRAGLGRRGIAGKLRRRAAAGRPAQCRHDRPNSFWRRTVWRRARRDRRRQRRGRAPARGARR